MTFEGPIGAQLIAQLSWRMRRAREWVAIEPRATTTVTEVGTSLVLVKSGTADLATLRGREPLTSLVAGDLAVITEALHVTATANTTLVFLALEASDPTRLSTHLPRAITVQQFVDLEPHVAQLIRACPRESDTSIASVVCSQIATTVMATVLRAWITREATRWPTDDVHLNAAIAAMHAYPERDWTVASLATVAASSRSVFAMRFNDVLGTTPLRYLTTLRMDLAQMHLREGRTVGEAARRVGYMSDDGFARAFRRWFGLGPRQWKCELNASPPIQACANRDH